MAVRYKDGRWQCEFQQAGVRVFRRLYDGATKAQAQALETRLRGEIFEARALGRQPELSLQAAIDLWLKHTLGDKKDQKKPVQNAALLAPFVAGKSVAQATEAAREATAAWSNSGTRATHTSNTRDSNGGLSPATINRRLAVLKAACHYAWKQGWAVENVSGKIPKLREAPGREVYLTRSQILVLASSAPTQQCAAAILWAAYSGVRVSELLALPKQPAGATSVSVSVSKTGKPRLVPIAGPLRPYLSALPLQLSSGQLRSQFCSARTKAGMPHVRFHDLRHSAASMLINAGVDLYVVGAILGHQAPQTTKRYAHLADATLRKAMRKLR